MRVKISEDFRTSYKQLKKRHKSLDDDFERLLNSLLQNPMQGVELFGGARKIRLAITSKGRGKSGGARVITHTVLVESHGADITLVTIYDKSDQASITDRELKKLMKKNGLE